MDQAQVDNNQNGEQNLSEQGNLCHFRRKNLNFVNLTLSTTTEMII